MSKLSKLQNKSIKDLWRYFQCNILKIKIYKLHYLKTSINYRIMSEYLNNFDLNVKELSYNDFLLGDKSIFYGKKMDVVKQRLEDPTYKAYGILDNNVLVYSTWISLNKMGLPVKSSCILGLNEGLLEDSYCHPTARGRGIHAKMNLYRLAKLYKLGKTECVAIVLDGNIPAFKVQMQSGFTDLGCFYAGKIMGVIFVTLKKGNHDRLGPNYGTDKD